MLEIIVETICFAMFAIINFCLMKDFLQYNKKWLTIKNIILLIILIIISVIIYTNNYLIQPVFIRIILNVIIFSLIFEKPIMKVSISFFIIMIITLIADIISYLLLINFIQPDLMRSNWFYMLVSNFEVITIILLIMRIKPLINILKKIIINATDKDNTFSFIFYSLSYVICLSMLYKLSLMYKMDIGIIINVAVIMVFILLTLFMFYDKLRYINLMNQYDALFIYVQQFEDTIDNMNVSNHESKNQLAILKGYLEEKNVKESLNIVNDMITDNCKKDGKIISKLKNIPKGGIKGLIYYKVMISQNKKLNITIDISKNVYKSIQKIDEENIKIICRLIGIYLDNAIEAASLSQNKIITIEIYDINNRVEFVFSNTYDKSKLNFDKIGTKGYTTKGKGHGQGTYLARKLVEKSNILDQEQFLINDMYVQKILIKEKNKNY